MARPSVVVAIPVKNGAAYLPEAIESVLAQDAELTVHVVDNLSDDGSVDVARGYVSDGRVRVEVNDRDLGAYGNLNRILSDATADYFVPFAADDVMQSGNLARKLEVLQETGAGMVHSPAQLIDDSGQPVGMWPDHSQTPAILEAPEFFARLVPHDQVSTQSVVVRTDELRAIGGFDARSLFCADWLTWMRLSLRVRVATVNEMLISNRVHGESGTSTLARIKGRDLPATLDRVFRDPAMPERWRGQCPQIMAAHLLELAHPLQRDGIRTIAQGWGAYMTMGRRMALLPGDAAALGHYLDFIAAAGLAAPTLPLEAVTVAPSTADDAAALAGAVHELEGRLARLFVAVHPDLVDRSLVLLEPYFVHLALDVALVPTGDALSHVTPGRLVLAQWESEMVAQAEKLGVPVYPYGLPNPFDRRPDRSVWETIDPAACLP